MTDQRLLIRTACRVLAGSGKRLTLAQLGERLGVSAATVTAWHVRPHRATYRPMPAGRRSHLVALLRIAEIGETLPDSLRVQAY